MDRTNFNVGQRLLRVTFPTKQGDVHEFKELMITKVGRSWLTFDNAQRADLENLTIDHSPYASNQRCFLNREQFDNEMALRKAWSGFRDAVHRNHKAPTTDIEAIREAARLLNLTDLEGDRHD